MREFELNINNYATIVMPKNGDSPIQNGIIHVIEYAAYEALKKERDELAHALKHVIQAKDDAIDYANAFRADLKLALEALKEVSENFLTIGVPEIVYTTLAKIKNKNEL